MACQQEADRVKPQLSSLTESVYASLSVQPSDMYYAYSSVGGIVKSNLVTESDEVTIGQVLVQIDNTNPQRNMENARLAYELAKDNYMGDKTILNELESQIIAARLKLGNDSVNYVRQMRLHEQSIGSQNDYDTRKLAFDISKRDLATLKSKYAQTKNQLEAQWRQADNNFKTSLKTATDYSVKSELAGKVYELMKEPGESVSLQEPVAMIGSSDSFLVDMLVDEVDIAKVEIGQKVLIRLDAYGHSVFEGNVSKIYPKMDTRSQTFKIEALFKQQPHKLYPGLTGEANIITQQKEHVLTIPYNYLIDGNKVKITDKIVEVEVGIKNFERVEIISGLDTNTYIYKPE